MGAEEDGGSRRRGTAEVPMLEHRRPAGVPVLIGAVDPGIAASR